jgi:hypothetical protein
MNLIALSLRACLGSYQELKFLAQSSSQREFNEPLPPSLPLLKGDGGA